MTFLTSMSEVLGMADFTLTGNVVKADSIAPFAETTGQSGAREVTVAGNTGGNPFEVTLRIQSDSVPTPFDPLGQVSLAQDITVEVTL